MYAFLNIQLKPSYSIVSIISLHTSKRPSPRSHRQTRHWRPGGGQGCRQRQPRNRSIHTCKSTLGNNGCNSKTPNAQELFFQLHLCVDWYFEVQSVESNWDGVIHHILFVHAERGLQFEPEFKYGRIRPWMFYFWNSIRTCNSRMVWGIQWFHVSAHRTSSEGWPGGRCIRWCSLRYNCKNSRRECFHISLRRSEFDFSKFRV